MYILYSIMQTGTTTQVYGSNVASFFAPASACMEPKPTSGRHVNYIILHCTRSVDRAKVYIKGGPRESIVTGDTRRRRRRTSLIYLVRAESSSSCISGSISQSVGYHGLDRRSVLVQSSSCAHAIECDALRQPRSFGIILAGS